MPNTQQYDPDANEHTMRFSDVPRTNNEVFDSWFCGAGANLIFIKGAEVGNSNAYRNLTNNLQICMRKSEPNL